MPKKKSGHKKIRAVIDEDLLGADLSPLKKKIKYITTNALMGRSGAKDPEILQKCSSENLHLITANVSDFIPLLKSHPHFKSGVIGLTGSSQSKSIKRLAQYVSETMPYHEQYEGVILEVSSQKVVKKFARSSAPEKEAASSDGTD